MPPAALPPIQAVLWLCRDRASGGDVFHLGQRNKRSVEGCLPVHRFPKIHLDLLRPRLVLRPRQKRRGVEQDAANHESAPWLAPPVTPPTNRYPQTNRALCGETRTSARQGLADAPVLRQPPAVRPAGDSGADPTRSGHSCSCPVPYSPTKQTASRTLTSRLTAEVQTHCSLIGGGISFWFQTALPGALDLLNVIWVWCAVPPERGTPNLGAAIQRRLKSRP